ncbi:MAG: class I SAM-dependent methyltransferase [Anaerolineae bacterium]
MPDDYTTNDYLAEFYDYVVPYRTRQDVSFFVDLAREAEGPVLEVGCGTGRVLIPTAREGITITGLDVSTAMLNVCRTRLANEAADVQARVTLVEYDMRDFDLEQQFALITIPFRSFQHMITVEDQLTSLACMRRHLVEGGRLVLDLFNPSLAYLVDESRLGEYGEEPEFTMPDGRRVVRRARILSRDLLEQVQQVELVYYVTHPDGRQERQSHQFPMRYLFRYEAEHLLVRAGFEVEAVYADYDRSPYGSKYPGELIFVARKR